MQRRAFLLTAAMTTSLPSTPSQAEDGRATLQVVLRHDADATRADDAFAPVAPIQVPLPDGSTGTMSAAWYDLVGDLQARFVYIGASVMRTLHTEELAALGLTPAQALTLALANLERLHGAPQAVAWHNLQAVKGRSEDFDSSYFLARSFWHGLLATHADGLVVAAARTDLLVFAPASDTAAVDSLRKGVAGLYSGGRDYGLSSALYLFKDDRWTVFQPPSP